jgi:hypothetical protein
LSGNKLARLLARATVIVGTSHTRSNEVDALVDICVALETLLANRGDRLKAEAIAARYWLLFSVAGVSDANTHPLELYDFYMLRNDIVHGVERRIASRQDVTRLEYAADAAIDSIRELITADTSLQSAKQLFRLLQSEQVINRVLSHPDLSEPQESAIAVRNLLKHWQNGNR